jgi:hypothetical protein
MNSIATFHPAHDLVDDSETRDSRAPESAPREGSFWKRLFGKGTPATPNANNEDSIEAEVATAPVAEPLTPAVSANSPVSALPAEAPVDANSETTLANEPVAHETGAPATAAQETTDESDGVMLHITASLGQVEDTARLLEQKADVTAADHHGRTPLHRAVLCGSKEVAELLLSHGANVNAKNAFGLTPLHSAASFGLTELAELLLARGADVNAQDNYGGTPLQFAMTRGREETADLLRQHGAADSARAEVAPQSALVLNEVTESTDENEANAKADGQSSDEVRQPETSEVSRRALSRRALKKAARAAQHARTLDQQSPSAAAA